MSTIKKVAYPIMILLLSSCIGNAYYDSLNEAPTMSLSQNQDTIKTSGSSTKILIQQTVTCHDYNMNMDKIEFEVSDPEIKMADDKGNPLSEKTKIGSYVETYSYNCYVSTKKEGNFIIKYTLTDKYHKTVEQTTKLHSFYNWLPVAVVKNFSLSGTILTMNLTSSYDSDARFGGAIQNYLLYIDGESVMEFSTANITVMLSSQTATNISKKMSNVYVACRDNDAEIGNKVKLNF